MANVHGSSGHTAEEAEVPRKGGKRKQQSEMAEAPRVVKGKGKKSAGNKSADPKKKQKPLGKKQRKA